MAKNKAPSKMPLPANELGAPSAIIRNWLPSGPHGRTGPEVLVSLARAPRGCRVFLESMPTSGPLERVRAFELPRLLGSDQREFRALLPPEARGQYVPIAVADGSEIRGVPFRIDRAQRDMPGGQPTDTRPLHPLATSTDDDEAELKGPTLAPPKLDLIAHVESELPKFTSFGPTPEGLRIAFYISGGRWTGPKVHASYRSEGGDWVLVRKDGVAIPNARATLETSDGALLYYELTGTIDLGPDGYERGLANQWPKVAALSLVARISTSSERWGWLNRSTLIGAGIVDLNVGHTRYDLFALGVEPSTQRE